MMIREYLLGLDSEKEAKRRTVLQFWIGGLGLSAAALISGLWFGIKSDRLASRLSRREWPRRTE
jgi:hypothetical protein